MNKYCIKSFLEDRLSKYASNFKSTSFDVENNVYLCNDDKTSNVYDFDKYVKDNYASEKLPASPDAIFLGNKKLYFIEFKNQTPSEIDSQRMKRKFEHGTSILTNLLSEFVPRDVEYVFCIVHAKQKARYRYFNPTPIESNIAKFGLEEINSALNNFYSEIISRDVDFYKEQFEELQC